MVKRHSADIRSPDVLKRFRHRFIKFDEVAQRALEASASDVSSTAYWLKGEQLRYWRAELRRRHEKMKDAWREYVYARHGDRRLGKPSCVDERKAFELAKRRKREAEAKIERVQGWAGALEREAERLSAPLSRLMDILTTQTPRAIARLDHMLDNLEIYLRPSRPAPKGAAPAAAKAGEEADDAED